MYDGRVHCLRQAMIGLHPSSLNILPSQVPVTMATVSSAATSAAHVLLMRSLEAAAAAAAAVTDNSSGVHLRTRPDRQYDWTSNYPTQTLFSDVLYDKCPKAMVCIALFASNSWAITIIAVWYAMSLLVCVADVELWRKLMFTMIAQCYNRRSSVCSDFARYEEHDSRYYVATVAGNSKRRSVSFCSYRHSPDVCSDAISRFIG